MALHNKEFNRMANCKKYSIVLTLPDENDLSRFVVSIEECFKAPDDRGLIPITCLHCHKSIDLEIQLDCPTPDSGSVVILEEKEAPQPKLHLDDPDPSDFIVEEYLVEEITSAAETPPQSFVDYEPKAEIVEVVVQDTPVVDSFLCSKCGKSFPKRASLSAHDLYVHRREQVSSYQRRYECDICRRDFPNKYKLRMHMQAIHLTDQRPPKKEQCPNCSLAFHHRHQLQRHGQRCHAWPSKFSCGLCPNQKGFAARGELEKHVQRVHFRVEKTEECEICQKRYHDKYQLGNHRLTHFPPQFKCQKCPKLFYQKKKLDIHQITHNPVPRFACSICGKQFARKMGKVVHERIHTGERSYACSYPNCTSRFYDDGTLRQHKLGHIRKDLGLGSMPLTEIAKRYYKGNGKCDWEIQQQQPPKQEIVQENKS